MSRRVFVVGWAFGCVFNMAFRFAARNRFSLLPWWGTPVLVVGPVERTRDVIRRLNNSRRLGLRPTLIFDDACPPEITRVMRVPVTSSIAAVEGLIESGRLEYAIFVGQDGGCRRARGAQCVLRHSGRGGAASNRAGRDRGRRADRHDQPLRLGSTVGVVSLHPLQRFRVVGIVRYGGAVHSDRSGCWCLTLPVAQQMFNKQGVYDEIDVAARPGVSSQQLVRQRSRPLLARHRAGQDARGTGSETHQARRGGARDRPLRAARVRRNRAVRRRVRDLQHAVGHGRAANPRARDAAHARCLAAPGARRGRRSRRLVIGVLASLIGLRAGSGSRKRSRRCSPRWACSSRTPGPCSRPAP